MKQATVKKARSNSKKYDKPMVRPEEGKNCYCYAIAFFVWRIFLLEQADEHRLTCYTKGGLGGLKKTTGGRATMSS